MKILEATFRKNNLLLKQVERTGNIAIYSVHLDEGEPVCGYEVIKVVIVPEKIVFGNPYPAHEKYPGNEEWGKHGFSWATFEQADRQFKAILQSRVSC